MGGGCDVDTPLANHPARGLFAELESLIDAGEPFVEKTGKPPV